MAWPLPYGDTAMFAELEIQMLLVCYFKLLTQARPEDADKKFEEKKRWDDTVKAKEEDLARVGLDEKKVCWRCGYAPAASKPIQHCNRRP